MLHTGCLHVLKLASSMWAWPLVYCAGSPEHDVISEDISHILLNPLLEYCKLVCTCTTCTWRIRSMAADRGAQGVTVHHVVCKLCDWCMSDPLDLQYLKHQLILQADCRLTRPKCCSQAGAVVPTLLRLETHYTAYHKRGASSLLILSQSTGKSPTLI